MPQPKVHPTLQKLYEAVGERGSAVTLEGYVGPAPSGRVRLYGSLQLGSCVEIPDQAILHYEENESSGRTTLYVDSSADLTVMTVSSITAAQLREKPSGGTTGGGSVADCIKELRQKCIDDRIIDGVPPARAERVCDEIGWLFDILCRSRPIGGVVIA